MPAIELNTAERRALRADAHHLDPVVMIGGDGLTEPVLKETLHTVFGAVHEWAGYVLYVIFALHVLGALKHQFMDGEKELQRMLPR